MILRILTGAWLAAAPLFSLPCRNVLAYYTDWSKYGAAAYGASKIPFGKLTHICHAFILPNADSSLNVGAGYLEPALISGAHAAGVKVIASIGGASATADANFRLIAASAALRASFAANIKNFLLANGYDGADIDWEFPGSAADKANFTSLVAALRAEFNASPSHPEFLITGAYSWTTYFAQWYDLPGLIPNIDFFNIMTYDFHGTWSNHAGHNAPLGASAGDPDGPLSTPSALSYFTSRGVPLSKINFGVPFYGYEFPVENLFNSCGGSCSAGATRPYSDIQSLVGSGWTRTWDAAASSPYLREDAGARVIAYDDAQSIQAKCDWALNTRGVGGVFMWDLSNDYLGPGTQPLLDAMRAPLSCGSPTPTATPTSTFTPQPVPARIQAEDYSNYYDASPGNTGGQYRADNVDIEATLDAGGGYDVGWIESGDWCEYSISVATAGMYDLSYRVASNLASAMTLQAQVDGSNLGSAVSIPGSGGWQTWGNVTLSSQYLSAGNHLLRLNFGGGGYNLNYIDIALKTTPTPSFTPVPPGSTETSTPTASPTKTASPTVTDTPTALPTGSYTSTPTPSATPTPTLDVTATCTALPSTPLRIEKALPVPNPNPAAIYLRLSNRAELVELHIYSAGNSSVAKLISGPYNPGNCMLKPPLDLQNGSYFYTVVAKDARGTKSNSVKSIFVILK